MKIIRIIITIIIILFLSYAFIEGIYFIRQSSSKLSQRLNASPNQSNGFVKNDLHKNIQQIPFNEKEFLFSFATVSAQQKIDLSPNFSQKLAAKTLFKNNTCEVLINGGFYAKENRALGLFISNTNLVNNRIESQLFDGIISQKKEGKIQIEIAGYYQYEEGRDLWALQTGPILFYDKTPTLLKIKNDEYTRRSFVAINENNTVYFFSIFGTNSNLFGPQLSELPQIVDLINKNLNLHIVNALNLDGGTASAFYTQNISISEQKFIGSFFCVK